jgi:hypothetical protein
MRSSLDGYTDGMTATPSEPGVPAEEGIEPANMAGDLSRDPDKVPNAPNRDPAVPPDDADSGAGDDPDTPKGFESFEDPAAGGGNWTSLSTGGVGPDAPIREQ